ncbi:MAG: S-methyl-5'-thioadenosine phosphorylase [SAR202 cluster bacterium]|nr:S-methyl-5'-thioadenosine phosphorylase [SAR202 cluster bacterium]|tara:strand:+ start:10100 stop:10960 length:861 start_codon:yes stop_codon:yes gene_type:complete
MDEIRIGIIGGSGLYEIDGLVEIDRVFPDTPYGKPSAPIIIGTFNGEEIAFLPRHGVGHSLSPSEIPNRANIYSLKSLGVQRLVSVSAVGSLREDIQPLDMVIPDQLIDRTKSRASTFFESGIVAHISFAEPFCTDLRKSIKDATSRSDARFHDRGTYVVIEGPQFSTKAESLLYREWSCDIIGMTALPEAKLAREAEMCYAVLACATDYDCWHDSEQVVTVDMVIANLLRNVEVSKSIIRDLVSNISKARSCNCGNALENAIITSPAFIDVEAKKRLGLLINRYI